jgi:phosphate transport system substrate-binding protein
VNKAFRTTVLGVGAALAMTSLPTLAASREYISIVGSSTVYPFTTVVAERFGKASGKATPKVESTGTGGGMKLFCAGVGTNHPDMANASRRMKKSEFDACGGAGVSEIVEVMIGYDGIAIANSVKAAPIQLTRKDLFLALAKNVPDPGKSGKAIANPYKTWKEVNPALPANKIEVLGPPPTSGTRDAFGELVMEPGCKTYPWIKDMEVDEKDRFKALCYGVREDGAYIEAGENDNLIVQKLVSNPNALGIFGYSFLEENGDKVQGAVVEGVAPTYDTISDKSYSVSRPLFIYVKKAHVGVVPGIEGFLAELTSEKAWGEDGYLAEKGLIPLPKALRQQVATDTKAMKLLDGQELH